MLEAFFLTLIPLYKIIINFGVLMVSVIWDACLTKPCNRFVKFVLVHDAIV